jgi:hypothetical protein
VRRPSVADLPDPLRDAVGVQLEAGGLFCIADLANDRSQYLDWNRPPPGVPDLYCPWTCSEDGRFLQAASSDKVFEPKASLGFLLEHLLVRWGLDVGGAILWHDERFADAGAIIVRSNVIEVHDLRSLLQVQLTDDEVAELNR